MTPEESTPTRRRFLVSLAGGCAALAGCGYRHGGGDPRWTSDALRGTTAPSTYLRSGAVLVGVVASETSFDFDRDVWTDGGRVVAVGLDDGDERWSFRSDRRFTRGAAAAAGTYVLGHEGPGVLAVADGERRWDRETDAPVVALAHDGETAYVTTASGRLRAFDGATGDPRWTRSFDRTGAFRGALDADERGVYVDGAPAADGSRGLRAFAPDGTERWRRSREATAPRYDASVAVDDGTLYVAGGTTLAALSTSDGTERWRRDVGAGLAGVPSVVADRVYHAAPGRLTCRSVADGERLWTRAPGGRWGREFTSGVAPGEDVVCVGEDDRFVGLDAATGEERWRVAEGDPVARAFSTADAAVAALSDGTLSARYR